MNNLVIDSSNNKNVFVKLELGSENFVAKSDSSGRHPESLVVLLEKVLDKAGIELKDLDIINFNEGPGSYTGLKVGASVANALSFAIGKKVNTNVYGQLVEVTYE